MILKLPCLKNSRVLIVLDQLIPLLPEGQELIGDALGPDCGTTNIEVLILSMSEDGWDVAVVPNKKCRGVRVGISTAMGTVR